MKRMLKSGIAVVAFLAITPTWADWADVPNAYWTQSDMLIDYFAGITPAAGVGFATLAETWQNAGQGAPDYTGFQEAVGIVLQQSDVTPQLVQDDIDNVPDVDVAFANLGTMTAEQTALVRQELINTVGLTAEQADALLELGKQYGADGVLDDDEAAQFLAVLGGAGIGMTMDEIISAARTGMGGFAPTSAPLILSRGMMQSRLATLHPYHHSVRGGVHAWMERSEYDSDVIDDKDQDTIGVMPYVESEEDGLLWTVAVPVLHTDMDRIEEDDYWSGGIEGSVQKTYDNGSFIGLRAAGLTHYVEVLPDNDFLSLSVGPFAGHSVALAENVVATGMGLVEAIITEYEDDTVYFMGGLGLSYMPTEKVALHAYGLYSYNTNTYVDEDDDFFDVGAKAEVALTDNLALGVAFGTILDSEDVQARTLSFTLSRQF